MNELLTAYLYGLYALRRGSLSAANSMSHVLDLMALARGTRRALEDMAGLTASGLGVRPTGRREPGGGDPNA